jgi:hypothetical protein
MKHGLILYDITFIDLYNVNSIINVFDDYGLKCHYFQCLNYIVIIFMLTSIPWLFIIIIIIIL